MKYAVEETKKYRISNSIVVTFAILVFSPLSTAQAKITLPKTAKLVPPETIFMVDIDDFGQLKSQFEKTNLYKFYKDPLMAAFVNDIKTKLREKIQELDDNDIFKTIYNADILPQGRVAIALVVDEQTKDGNEPPILFITQWGENIAKIKEAVNKMAKKNIELGGHQKRSEDYRGVSIEIMLDEGAKTFTYCFIDDCYIGTANIDLLKFVIAHIKGATSPTLADESDYTPTIKAVGPYHDIDFYVNIRQIIKTIFAEDTTGNTQTMMANLGLDNVISAGTSIGLARSPGSSYCVKSFLKVDGTKKGICKMLETEPAVLRVPRFIPASAYSATFLNLSIKKAYNELYNILYNMSPMYASIMYAPLLPPSPQGEPGGLELKSDIIDHLGSQIVIAQSINKPFSNNPNLTESLVALAVNNRSALEKSLALLHSKMIAPNNPDARRELLGHTIYLITLPGMPFLSGGATPMQELAEPSVPPMLTMAFTITETHLIFGTESTVERAIRTLSSTSAASLDSAKWFTRAKSVIPSIVGLASLKNDAASTEFLWWMMKETGKVDALSTSSFPVSQQFFPPKLSKLANFNLLPEFDAVRKYFGTSAFYGVSKPDGFFFEFKNTDSSDNN